MDLVFIVDHSDSIDDDEFEQQRTALLNAANELHVGTTNGPVSMAIVSFRGVEAEVTCPLEDQAGIIDCIANFERVDTPFGLTPTSEGLELAIDIFNNIADPNTVNVAVLLTDGNPTAPFGVRRADHLST